METLVRAENLVPAILSKFWTAVEEKEERLLPPPYQTNCRDNGPSDDAENFTNPNSYQVCLEMCSSEISKDIYGCDYGMTMQLSANHLCHGAVSSHLQAFSTGMHKDNNRHFSSRAPGLSHLILYNQARTVIQTIFRWEQAGLLMTAHTVRRGSQSSTPR
uniref:Uncharacterized protein n=1 Tax=Araneus ventricosus TaxID=182803 RepID=A0A4Y2TDP2_ARAVE|nr:hypothetical protein AVEN_84188-1 [Araneus ventricosus]GBN98657.1 hypothetical protein AVEN_107671-1 [Araneus ventricosus]GBN98658.1 hypothetical protein AVEN_115662-1 [Araneus ventricosus]